MVLGGKSKKTDLTMDSVPYLRSMLLRSPRLSLSCHDMGNICLKRVFFPESFSFNFMCVDHVACGSVLCVCVLFVQERLGDIRCLRKCTFPEQKGLICVPPHISHCHFLAFLDTCTVSVLPPVCPACVVSTSPLVATHFLATTLDVFQNQPSLCS